MPPQRSGAGTSERPWRTPPRPASPKKSVPTDQPYAESTPTETSVSIVRDPCRRWRHAARWNRSPPQNTTGVASTSENHCQYRNCQNTFMATAITGRLSARQTRARWRRSATSGSSSARGSGDSASERGAPSVGSVERSTPSLGGRGAGTSERRGPSVGSVERGAPSVGTAAPDVVTTDAPNPSFSTVRTRTSGPPSWVTRARPVARFTSAVTPASFPRRRSIREVHAPHVMPVTASSVTRVGGVGDTDVGGVGETDAVGVVDAVIGAGLLGAGVRGAPTVGSAVRVARPS